MGRSHYTCLESGPKVRLQLFTCPNTFVFFFFFLIETSEWAAEGSAFRFAPLASYSTATTLGGTKD